MGRRTYEAAVARLGKKSLDGRKVVVVSRTMKPAGYPKFTILPELDREKIQALHVVAGNEKTGKDIWLMGGGVLFRSLLDMGLVDMVEVSIMPVVLGTGIPLLPPPANQARLKLVSHRIYRSGIVSLAYEVQR